jgi:hypothetical protein
LERLIELTGEKHQLMDLDSVLSPPDGENENRQSTLGTAVLPQKTRMRSYSQPFANEQFVT